jgi:hypothetical protein
MSYPPQLAALARFDLDQIEASQREAGSRIFNFTFDSLAVW